MRFHHSTRRGRNRLSSQHQSAGHRSAHTPNSASRWSHLAYCRETNIHFNRRVPVEPPLLPGELEEFKHMSLGCEEGKLDQESSQSQANHKIMTNNADARQVSRKSAPRDCSIDIESARAKLVAQVEKHPFWSNKAARKMRLTKIEERKIYIYELTSYCERRELEWRYEPYKGGLVQSTALYRLELPGDERLVAVAPPSGSYCRSASATNYPPSPLSSSTSAHRPSTPQPCARYESQSSVSGGRKSPASSEFVWQVQVESGKQQRPTPFVAQVHTRELPHTSFVKRCHGCQGRGRIKCQSCYGVGYEVCISCSGKGTTKSLSSFSAQANNSSYRSKEHSSRNSTQASGANDDCTSSVETRGWRRDETDGCSSNAWLTESCHFCHGAGQKRCWVCAGKSFNACSGCAGAGQLRCFQNLRISWTNHHDESTINNADNIIPRDRLRLCTGLLLIDETADRLAPLAGARLSGGASSGQVDEPNQLHAVSRRLLERHAQSYCIERLIKQRQKVTRIDCHIVSYEWKRQSGHFIIYGAEHKVYIAKYPYKSFCNIT